MIGQPKGRSLLVKVHSHSAAAAAENGFQTYLLAAQLPQQQQYERVH